MTLRPVGPGTFEKSYMHFESFNSAKGRYIGNRRGAGVSSEILGNHFINRFRL